MNWYKPWLVITIPRLQRLYSGTNSTAATAGKVNLALPHTTTTTQCKFVNAWLVEEEHHQYKLKWVVAAWMQVMCVH